MMTMTMRRRELCQLHNFCPSATCFFYRQQSAYGKEKDNNGNNDDEEKALICQLSNFCPSFLKQGAAVSHHDRGAFQNDIGNTYHNFSERGGDDENAVRYQEQQIERPQFTVTDKWSHLPH